MFRFISTLRKKELNKRYLDIFKQRKNMNRKLEKLFDNYPELRVIIPNDYQTVERILTAPFDVLAIIYYNYSDYLSGLDKNTVNVTNKAITAVFNYESHQAKIGHFLIDPANEFPVHNCIYCDMTKVSGYVNSMTGNRVREFDTEHILDKGKCPLVSLSLYNFLPSCGTCNGANHKGEKTLGRSIDETILLSPTTINNKFAEEVQFTIIPLNDDINDLIMFKTDDELGLDFKGQTDKYYQTIEMFKLRDRYNERKKSLFEVLEKIRFWSVYFGLEYPITDENQKQKFESVFGFKRRASAFEPMEKCRRDIFEEYFGKLPD